MQSPYLDHQSVEASDNLIHLASVIPNQDYPSEELTQSVTQPTQFRSHFVNYMELYADAPKVAEYLDDHHSWFRRCAQPMKVESIGKNAYALVIGKFGSFGYEIEPKVGLDLLPQEEGIYRIETVPVPGHEPYGYDVDFRASLELVELEPDAATQELLGSNALDKITRVQWQLDLKVSIQFPKFIHALPMPLIQSTGDHLLQQVVRQVSNRLTRKVQEDFCKTYGMVLPKRHRKWFFQQSQAEPGCQENC